MSTWYKTALSAYRVRPLTFGDWVPAFDAWESFIDLYHSDGDDLRWMELAYNDGWRTDYEPDERVRAP